MRMIDDRIIYALNTTIPTDSFSKKVNATEQCKTLFVEVSLRNDEVTLVVFHYAKNK